MDEQLQEIVDGLAEEIGRSVSLEDRHLRLLYNSPHQGPVDPSRYECLLKRGAGDEAREWMFRQGIGLAAAPVVVEPNPEIGFEYARHCFPVRCQGQRLGYVIVIDPQRSIAEREIGVCQDVADAAGRILYRDRLLVEAEGARAHALLSELLGPDPMAWVPAASALIDECLMVDRGAVAVVAARVVDTRGALDPGLTEVAVGSALSKLRRSVNPGSGLQLNRPDHGAFLVSVQTAGLGGEALRALATKLHTNIMSGLEDDDQRWLATVGVGGVVPSLDDARRSYRQAISAVRVAERVASSAGVIDWSELGVYQILSRFPHEESVDWLSTGLGRVFEEDASGQLVLTLETYLDLGCDAKATAEQLVLHRASLYRRLHKVEQIAGLSLKSGQDRLELHLALKLARLAGAHPLPPPPVPIAHAGPVRSNTENGSTPVSSSTALSLSRQDQPSAAAR